LFILTITFLEAGAALPLPLDRVELDEENPLYVPGELASELESYNPGTLNNAAVFSGHRFLFSLNEILLSMDLSEPRRPKEPVELETDDNDEGVLGFPDNNFFVFLKLFGELLSFPEPEPELDIFILYIYIYIHYTKYIKMI
jgi:hypothetical protein